MKILTYTSGTKRAPEEVELTFEYILCAEK